MDTRDDSVVRSTLPDQGGSGGAIPASSLFFHIGETADAMHLVSAYHYSHRPPSNVQFVGSLHTKGGLFQDKGPMVAAAFFSIPPTRWSEPVLELSRLVRLPTVRIPLTMLIRLCCTSLRQKGNDLLVSFADRTQGHEGYVYQAANWNYDGCRECRMDGLVVNGDFVPGRSCNRTWGTRSPTKLREQYPRWSIFPHYDNGKHLYWKTLNEAGQHKAERLNLYRRPYPKAGNDT